MIYACRQLQALYLVYELGLILCECPFIPDIVLSCLFNLAQIVTVCLLIIFRFFHVAKVARITLYSLSLSPPLSFHLLGTKPPLLTFKRFSIPVEHVLKPLQTTARELLQRYW